jgi:hypothetical protein
VFRFGRQLDRADGRALPVDLDLTRIRVRRATEQ